MKFRQIFGQNSGKNLEKNSGRALVVLLAALGTVIFSAGLNSGCEQKPSLSDDSAKEAYAMGRRIGGSLKAERVQFDKKALVAGIMDGLEGKSDLTDQQIAEAFNRLQQKNASMEKDEADKNLKVSEDFLAGNKARPGVKEAPSGLQFEVMQEGRGPRPKSTDLVRFHYHGTLLSGQKFDSSIERGQPVVFEVNKLIPGWQEALVNMPVGSKWKLFVPPRLAYGPTPRPGIPPNSLLTFDVELLEIVQQAKGADPAAAKTKKQ